MKEHNKYDLIFGSSPQKDYTEEQRKLFLDLLERMPPPPERIWSEFLSGALTGIVVTTLLNMLFHYILG